MRWSREEDPSGEPRGGSANRGSNAGGCKEDGLLSEMLSFRYLEESKHIYPTKGDPKFFSKRQQLRNVEKEEPKSERTHPRHG